MLLAKKNINMSLRYFVETFVLKALGPYKWEITKNVQEERNTFMSELL